MTDSRPSSRSEQKRARIRQAAYRSFRDFGYHETSVDSLCRSAGISKGSFYWHYDSKQEVYVDILETWTREVMDELIQQFETALDTDDAARALAGAFEREIHRGRQIVPLWLEFTVLARREPEIQRALSRFYRRARAAIAEMLRPLVRGELTEDELRATSAAILGAYAGIVMQDLADPTWVDGVAVARHFMAVLDRKLLQPHAAGQAVEVDPDPDADPDGEPDDADVLPPAPPLPMVMPPPDGERVERRELEALVSGVAPGSAERVGELRKLVLGIVPEANERVISGWRVIGYERDGLFAYIKPTRDDEVHLGFYHGASLEDPDRLLEGSGKRQRHVRIPLDGAIDHDALRRLIAAAADGRLRDD